MNHLTIVTASDRLEAFEKYVIPLLMGNEVSASFQGVDEPLPPTGAVMVMGNAALDALRETGLIKPKNMSMAVARTHAFEGRVFVTYDPNLIYMNPSSEPDILWDLQKVCRLLKTGSIEPTLGDYQWTPYSTILQTVKSFMKATEEAKSAPTVVSLDLETMGLSPFVVGKDILTLSLTFEYGKSLVYKVPAGGAPDPEVLLALKMLSDPYYFKLIGANLKFDINWIREKWGITFLNQVFDTTIVGALLNENISNSLNVHAKLHTAIGGYDDSFNLSHDKAHMEVALEQDPDGFLKYAGGDTDAVYRVYPIFKKKLLEDKALTNFYTKVLQPATKVFAKMEGRGVVVDIDQYNEVESVVRKEIKGLYAELIDFVPRRIQLKHREKTGQVKLKPRVIVDLMFSPMGFDLKPKMLTPGGDVSTAKEHLQMFADEPAAAEFIGKMAQFNQAEKTLSTYILGFKKHLRADGKFHPTYNLCRADYGNGREEGTVTGRTSASDPAYQCQPGHSLILTDRGYRRLDEILIGDIVMTHDGSWRSVTVKYDNGIKPVFRLTTKSGKAVLATGNHPILTSSGWVPLEFITLVDRVMTYGKASGSDKSDLWGDEGYSEVRHSVPGQLDLPVQVWGGDRRVRGEPAFGEYQKLRTPERQEQAQSLAKRLGEKLKKWLNSVRVKEAALTLDVDEEDLVDGFHEESVFALEYVADMQTWGISIDGSHSYVSNGIVVHNTTPKHTKYSKLLRTVFVPPPGMVGIGVDFSQGELRIFATLANETVMIAAYNQGIDVHMITGASAYGASLEEVMLLPEADRKKIRQGGKAGNFGLIYLISPEGFVVYARNTYGVAMTVPKAEEFQDTFFGTYPSIPKYQAAQIAYAKQHGKVVSPLGRVRHLPMIKSSNFSSRGDSERQSVNSPTQATLSDLGLMAMVEMDRRHPDFWFFGFVHDDLQAYVPADTWEYWAGELKSVMENLPLKENFGWRLPLTMQADISMFTTNMGEAVEYPKWPIPAGS